MKNPRNYWNKESCMKAALNCKTKLEFEKKYSGAYKSAYKNGWMAEICSHLVLIKKANNYWTKEKCLAESLKYNSKTSFNKNAKGAYKSALKNNWLDDICIHMPIQGSLDKRYNYMYEFEDNHVYIGLTCNINRRNNEHLNEVTSPVYQYILKTGLTPKLIYDNLKSVRESQEKEINLILEYKRNGWVLINKSKGGGLGSNKRKWNETNSVKEGLKYNTRLDFQKKSHSAYKFCLKNNLLDFACSHMIKKGKNKIENSKKWSKELCEIEALKYKTKKEFYTNSQNAYRFSIRNNFLNDICKHMIKSFGFWSI